MQLGVLLDSVGSGQKSISTILSLNKVSKYTEEYWDAIVFYLEFNRTLFNPKFALMNMSEIYGFTGVGVATDLKTAEILCRSFGPTKKYFYIWDLEWTLIQHDYERISKIYLNPELELIARSQDHAKEISRCWKEPFAIIENFHHEKLINTIKETSS